MNIFKVIWNSLNPKLYALSAKDEWIQPAYGVKNPEPAIDEKIPLIIKVILSLIFLLIGVLLYNKKFNTKKKVIIIILLILALVVSIVSVDIIYNYLTI